MFFRARKAGVLPVGYVYPLRPAPNVAVVLDPAALPTASSFEADTIAAPVNLLRALASGFPTLKYPLVAFTGTGYGTLTEADRNRFWRVFGVPVFEQRLDQEGRSIAFECEAHQGLHIPNGSPLEANELTPCPCGKPGYRIVVIAEASAIMTVSAP